MTPAEAYETTLEVTVTHFQDVDFDQDDLRAFIIGEAAGYLADLDMMPEVRKAALRGLVEASSVLEQPRLVHLGDRALASRLLFSSEYDLADQVAEGLNTAL